MLKTSPILSSSTNASSPAFRHASSRSSLDSTRMPTAVARPQQRRSSASASSSDVSSVRHSTSARRISGDTAVQSVATDSMDGIQHSLSASTSTSTSMSVSVAGQPISAQHQTPPSLSTQPMAAPSTVSPTQAAPLQTSSSLSPNKRRGSVVNQSIAPAMTTESASSTTDHQAPTSSPKTAKRVKPPEQPPKVVPIRYEFCAVEDVVELIAHMLAELIATNDAIRISSGGLTRFHSRTAPAISVRDYLHRLAKHATLTPPLLLAMVYYIDRLCALYQDFTINTLTVHRFLITAATVAAKGLSDSFWNNTTYARVGGVRVAELKMLELEFLYRVDWKIVPNPEVLVAYYQGLVERTPGYVMESDASSDDDFDDDEDVDDVEQ